MCCLRSAAAAGGMGRCSDARGHRLGGTSALLALVLWSVCFSQVALAQGPESTEPSPAPSSAPLPYPDEAATQPSGQGLGMLMIGIGKDHSLPFGGLPGPIDKGSKDEVLFEGGSAHPRFNCHGDLDSAAEEPNNIANRRLFIWTSKQSGIFDQLGWGNEEENPEMWITDARLEIHSEGGQAQAPLKMDGFQEKGTSHTVLRAELEEIITDSARLEVPPELEQATSVKVKYDCRREGSAVVHLVFQVVDGVGEKNEVCLRWQKACSMGWNDLEIKQVQPNTQPFSGGSFSSSGTKVFSGGEFDKEWTERMSVEGTQKGVTQLQLTSAGIMRLRRPQIESNQRLVSVEALGPLIYADGPSEVNQDPVSLTVTYVCNFDGFGDVTLILEKDTLHIDDEPEKLELRWRKHCGVTTYKHLQVYIRSDSNKSRTQAVSAGEVKAGFVRPCTGLNAHAQVVSDCSQKEPTFEVTEKEMRTSLDLEVDSQGLMEMPTFDPAPDLTYNGKVLRIVITQSPPVPGSPAKQRHSGQRKKQVLTVKYTCFKEGTSTVTVTLHVREHRAVYLAWRKKCAEPKIHVSKALTAPQAIVVTMFVCGLIGLVACMVFVVSSQGNSSKQGNSSQNNKTKGKYRNVNDGSYEDDDDDADIELPNRKGDSQVIGNKDRPGEVTYH